MEHSLRSLAGILDAWADAGRATLTEAEEAVAVNRLAAPDAIHLETTCREAGLAITMEDAGRNEVDLGGILSDFGPFRAVLQKPDDLKGPNTFLTNSGFEAALMIAGLSGIVRLVRCSLPFETATACFCPADETRVFEPRQVAAKARRVVRETGTTRVVSEDMGLWLLRETVQMPWADDAFSRWRSVAEPCLIRALSNEVEQDGIVFRGPPLVRLKLPSGESGLLDEHQFRSLQNAAAWVYDNERELEMRHGLYAAEIARTAAFGSEAFSVFLQALGPALESARIAYGLNLSQVSRDTLKALADLRKAISDETAKLAESTRSVAGSVAASLFAGLGLLITRSTTNIPGWMLVSLSVVLAVYVCAVVWSGKKFIRVQANIRNQWRTRLYTFLPTKEYSAMVEEPAKEAESAFNVAAVCGLTLSAVLVVGTFVFVTRTTPHAAGMTHNPASRVQADPGTGAANPPAGTQGAGTGQQLGGASPNTASPASTLSVNPSSKP